MAKENNIHFRVTDEEKQIIEFMAAHNGLKVSQYLLNLAKKDFNQCELKKYIKKLEIERHDSN